MTVTHATILSVQNTRVKHWASLLDKKHRDRNGEFLIEGIHLIQEAAACGAALQTVVYDAERGIPTELRALTATVDGENRSAVEWISASPAVMAKCTGTESAPPVFGVVKKTAAAAEEALFKQGALVVVLDGVRDPGNVGTIIRSADAVGADAVVLGRGCVDLYNPKTVRSTMGSLFHLPILEGDLKELLPIAAERGMKLVGTSLQAQHSCYSYDFTDSTWLLFGSESDGLSAEAAKLMNESIIIPMHGRSESLNVAMAATVLLYESMRQRRYS
ncbi:TrmH family RNA methyltransferase [Paenibacillus sp. GCM10023252]|uniref:TrmH family RNA methyltransferase n=1 Tax=Paenibacillus sp. GCM10023252 TaxID=3252649 RepID=UPI0036206FC6